MTEHKGVRLTRAQTVEVAKLLEQFGGLEDGFYRYTEPHNDTEISNLIGKPVKHVQNVRLDLYGQLWSPMKVERKANGHAKPAASGNDEIAALRQEIVGLRADLDSIWPVFKVTFLRLNQLLETLGEKPVTTDVPVEVIDVLRSWTVP